MIAPETHAARRTALMERVGRPILLVANDDRPRNQRINPVRFRQDSTFLYYTGCKSPGAAVLMAEGRSTLFLRPPADDDALWHGHVSAIEQQAAALGFTSVAPLDALDAACGTLRGQLVALAVPDREQARRASELVGAPLQLGVHNGDDALVDAVAAQRRRRDPEELSEMRLAARVTADAHRAAMATTRPGVTEQELTALFEAVLAAHGMEPAYGTILSMDGEILHNPSHDNTLVDGRLLLLDGGAEAASSYACDVTRTWPVSGRFDGRQRAVYDAVLAAQQAAIATVRAGQRYRAVHDAASMVLARFLADEGLLRCSPEAAVEAGAHALFYPHGTGHLIGLDVHDLEDMGDRITYAGRPRSDQFGTCYLRIDLDLEAGMVVTVEPGFYVVPAILADPQLAARFATQVDLDAARSWIGFGGIRIEDDVLVTGPGCEVLTADIPKEPAAIEALVGTEDSPLRRFTDLG